MSIRNQIQALRRARVPDLVARYEAVFGKPPRVRHREFLWKRIAWKIQEQRYGGLSGAAKRHLEELIAEIDLPVGDTARTVSGALRRPDTPVNPPVGTLLVRRWKGQEIRVTVVKGGFEWEGKVYRSLSAVARTVTGSKWNGRLFFGLTKRRRAQ